MCHVRMRHVCLSEQNCQTLNRNFLFQFLFFITGNDKSSRTVSMTIWVTNPTETEEYLHLYLTETGATLLPSLRAFPSTNVQIQE